MSLKLGPYPEYKDSGTPWLGEVPAHWDTGRAKRLFHKMDRPVGPSDETVTCFRDGVVTLRKHRRTEGFTESLQEIGYQGVRKGDLVIHAMDAFAGAIGVSDSNGKCTPVYAVCRPKPEADVHYYARIVREMARTEWIRALAKGIRERSTDFRYDEFARQVVPVPPIDEQVRIKSFLGRSDQLTQQLIGTKQRLIEFLNEQKQAMIHRAVTRGLDPDVSMKPTGLDWLPEVPEHWDIRRLKHCVSFVSGGTPDTNEPSFWNGNIPWVSPKDMKTFDIHDAEDHITEKAVRAGRTPLVPEGSVLMVVRSGILRRHIPVAVACQAVTINQDLKAMIVKERKLSPRFLAAQIAGSQHALLLAWRKLGATVESLEHDFLANTLFPMPPMSEQEDILDAIRSESRYIERAITRTHREIELIREYRTRLISDVVTGKLDVRGVTLPEVEEEMSPNGLTGLETEPLTEAEEVPVVDL